MLARYQICRTSWCDAPIRQYDHLTLHADGGPTSIVNAGGKCQACKLTKQAPRRFSEAAPDSSFWVRSAHRALLHLQRATTTPIGAVGRLPNTEHRLATILL